MNQPLPRTGIESVGYLERLDAEPGLDAASGPEARKARFAGIDADGAVPRPRLRPGFKPRSIFHPAGATFQNGPPAGLDSRSADLSDRLYQLVRNHRVRGHIIAAVDPLGVTRPTPPELGLDFYGFTESELGLLTNSPTLHFGLPLTIREIFQRLRDTYCRSIGVQYMHIDDLAVRQWLQRRMEVSQNRLRVSAEQQRRILTRLTDAVVFEEFLRKKFPGAKTFSLEGCETLLPLLDLALEKAGGQGAERVVLGMAHRGRLNVLAHILGKAPRAIFREFADADTLAWEGRGDVKHHLGYAGDWITANDRKIHLSLCFNPSHLEFINPVVLGRVRACQDRLADRERRRVLGILIHGDAAFAGEGVVQESLNLSRLPGYTVGGIVHVVINNQIGFTTSPAEGRSTIYATDVARMLQVPIFHVNGEDPEAVAQVVHLAMDFRARFQSDVFIDMYGYRRLGHNETDEPSFTQPVLYRAIADRPGVRDGYLEHLLKLGSLPRDEADAIMSECHAKLEQQLQEAPAPTPTPTPTPTNIAENPPNCRGVWQDYRGGPEPADDAIATIGVEELAVLLRRLTEVPAGFQVHPKLERGLQARREMAEERRPLDWAAAEALALGTLLDAGVPVRLTGQDTARGTFSQRHAILFDQRDGHAFTPLQHCAPGQASVDIYNSPLCETGSLGFEYGYSLDRPEALVLWEAQFGDFVNAAQVILDQFIASAEDKWERLSGLVLLLPHGFEGMGPEHSSARLERFLTLAAEDNIQVVQPTTPAQYFHVLRRQALRKWRKPLVVFTPKGLLRSPRAVSKLEQLAQGGFQRVIPDEPGVSQLRRILLCTGKVFYELADYREQHDRRDVAVVRLEQLYPLPAAALDQALKAYPDETPVFWVQEEPANMGGWCFLHERLGKRLWGRLPFARISRPESASPATGSSSTHKLEQARLVARAFGDPEPEADEVLANKPHGTQRSDGAEAHSKTQAPKET